jgi:protocatechuate 3,4-dioxygenase beta subunit
MRTFRQFFLVFVLLASGTASGQQLATLNGSVSDENGAALPNATVTLTGAGAPITQTANGTGQFSFRGLAPGSYRLRAQVEGFSDKTLPDTLVIKTGDNAITIRMQPLRE